MGRKSLAKERRSQIVEAYYRSLLANGIEGSSIVNIAKEAGMTPSILTHYFDDKDEMAVELTNRTIEKYENAYLGQLEKIEDPKERLETVLSMMFGDTFVDQDLLKAFLAVMYRASRNDQIRDALARMYERYYSYLTNLLLEVAGPENLDSEEAEKISVFVIALQDGIQGHWLLNPNKAQPSVALEIVKTILSQILES